MKKIILERLTLRNFKGFREFILSTNGGHVDAFGDNGTGKTTLFDAFTWLLFGKDSTNRSDFEIKELDAAGKVRQHKLEHSVEADLLVNGRRRTFRRVYAEKWTKKRGSITDSFEGHTTDYFIDGVPVKAGEYKEEVDSLIKEDLFKLLTSPTFFNEQLKKEERRKVLLEICGDITDAEVIHSNKALSKLPAILGERDVDKHKQAVKSRMKLINDEIADIPVRISESQRSQPEVTGLNEMELQEEIDKLRAAINKKETEIIRIQNGGESSVKEKRIREIDSELLDIQNRLQSETLDKVAQKRTEVGRIQGEYDQLRRQIDDKQHRIRQNERTIETRNDEANRLRALWTEENNRTFEEKHDENCPSCGQVLPEDRIQEAKNKHLADFNRSKAERLEQISLKGKAAKEDARQLEQAINQLTAEIDLLNDKMLSVQSDLAAAESELTELRSGIQDPKNDPDYQRLLAEKEAVSREIVQLRDDSRESIISIQREVADMQVQLRDLEGDKAKFSLVQKADKRIAELEQQEKDLASEYERLQEELFLTEEFTRSKVTLLDSKINSKFKHARFRLFEEQINGGLKEVCDTLYNGVPYDGGLNKAAQNNVGVDIINTLSEHYGFSAPIFFDNAESVTNLMETDAQVIRLIVSEKDKKLRIKPSNEEDAFNLELNAAINTVKQAKEAI